MREAADPQPLRRRVRRGAARPWHAAPIQRYLLPILAFQLVPAFAEPGGVAGQGEIDHIFAVAGVEFGAQYAAGSRL